MSFLVLRLCVLPASLQWSVHHRPRPADVERHTGVPGRRWVRNHLKKGNEGWNTSIKAQARSLRGCSTDGAAWYLGLWPEIMWMSNVSIYGAESFSRNYNCSYKSLTPLQKHGHHVFLQWNEVWLTSSCVSTNWLVSVHFIALGQPAMTDYCLL